MEEIMEFKLIEYLLAIEKYENISAAAKQLYVTPSALTQQLKKLESRIGARLFLRSNRKMIPTDAGKIYIRYAHRVKELEENATQQIQDLSERPTGTYKIGLTYDHGSDVFSRIYVPFRQKYPGIQLLSYQMLVPEMIDMIKEGELDLAYVLGKGMKTNKEYKYVYLSTENLVVGLNRLHPAAESLASEQTPCSLIDLDLLKNDYFAVALKKSTMRSQVIDPFFEKKGIILNAIVESSMNSFLEQNAALGFCDAIIPESRIRNRKDIVWFYLSPSARFEFGLVVSNRIHIGRALRYFIQLSRTDAKLYLDFPAPEELSYDPDTCYRNLNL